MILNLFSLPVTKVNLLESGLDLDKLKEVLYPLFKVSKQNNVDLEKQGGVSTYLTENKLHLKSEFQHLSFLVLQQAKLYWKVLDISDSLEPEIDQCWSNLHTPGAFTTSHSHSLMPIVGSFYLEAPHNSGDIVFTNPMEYGLTHIPFNGSIENKIETSVHVKTGDLCLFPGWVRHKTQENNSNLDRIVITFNLKYKGTYLDSQTTFPDMYGTQTSQIDTLMDRIYIQNQIIEELKKVR